MQNRVPVDDSWVTVDIYGDRDGSAIVIVPGVMADAAAWGAVAGRLEGWRTVAVVNRRGRRPSGPLGDGYGVVVEVADVVAVLRGFSDVRTLFGWSYGGLIALHAANAVEVPHVIAYEPVMAPFGAEALPALRQAHDAADADGIAQIALRQIAGMSDESVTALRSVDEAWSELRRLSAPLYPETLAINEAPKSGDLAVGVAQVDLISGELNTGRAPYGTSFADVARRVPHATVHQLGGQGHLAHLKAPTELARLVSRLGVCPD